MSDLELKIKELIIDVLNLEDIQPDDIQAEEPLFGEGLGLDSIDALELGVALHKRFGVKISAEDAEATASFASVCALAAYIEQHAQEPEAFAN